MEKAFKDVPYKIKQVSKTIPYHLEQLPQIDLITWWRIFWCYFFGHGYVLNSCFKILSVIK